MTFLFLPLLLHASLPHNYNAIVVDHPKMQYCQNMEKCKPWKNTNMENYKHLVKAFVNEAEEK